MMRLISVEMKKYLYYPYLLLAVLGSSALCLTATVWYDDTGKAMSTITLMVRCAGNCQAAVITQSALLIWIRGMNGWLPLMLPFLLSFGYVASLSSERQNGQLKFQLIRTGNFRYCVAKISAGMLVGGLLLFLTGIMFGAFTMLAFPHYTSFPFETQQAYESLYGTGPKIWIFVAKRLFGLFLYGMSGSVSGIGTAIFLRDRYMLLCLPFLLNYVYTQMIQKLVIDSYQRKNERTSWINAFDPANLVNISKETKWSLSVMLLLGCYAFLILLFWGEMKRRRCDG